LKNYIENRSNMSEKQVLKLFFEVCLGVAQMHNVDITHRDLKLENVLIDDSMALKLCDFGSATMSKAYVPKGRQIALAEDDIQANVS
jgi:serine/threonine protein kinase